MDVFSKTEQLFIFTIFLGAIIYFILLILGIIRNMSSNDESDIIRSETSKEQLRDVYHIAFLLRQKLVPDVVPPILHYAGFFQRHTHSTQQYSRARIITQRQAPSTCLVTTPLQSSARALNPVRKVVFAIKSCDQGWASDVDAGSWTWFTAGVYSKNNEDEQADSLGFEGLSMSEPNDRFLTRERVIFRNDVASSEMKTHIVEWSVDSEDEEARLWVSALGNGDRIAVRAWAQFGGWQNHFKSVSVAIYTVAVI